MCSFSGSACSCAIVALSYMGIVLLAVVIWRKIKSKAKKAVLATNRDIDINHSNVNDVEYEEVKDPYYSTIPSQIQTNSPRTQDTEPQNETSLEDTLFSFQVVQ